jgi:hypothetical protein
MSERHACRVVKQPRLTNSRRRTRIAAGARQATAIVCSGDVARWPIASFAHCFETDGIRRRQLRGRENILKRSWFTSARSA